MSNARIPGGLGSAAHAIRRASQLMRHTLKPAYSNFVTVYVRERLLARPTPLIVNLGCGEHRLAGAVNIDRRNTPAVDVICNVVKLPYRPASVRRIECYHVFEHLPLAQAQHALCHWFSLLEPGGTMVIECPDFDAAARDYLDGNEARLGNIFGLQRFPGDFHLWGWNGRRLRALLQETGFINPRQLEATDYHRLSEPCLRVEGDKPIHA